MTQSITITLQIGDGDPQTATFGLPDAADFDMDEDDMGGAHDPIDTLLPPALGATGQSASDASDTATPPGFDDGGSGQDSDIGWAEDELDAEDDAIAPPDVD